MTTIIDANVHNIAVKGTFDDCQVRFGLEIDFPSLAKPSGRTSSKLSSEIRSSMTNTAWER